MGCGGTGVPGGGGLRLQRMRFPGVCLYLPVTSGRLRTGMVGMRSSARCRRSPSSAPPRAKWASRLGCPDQARAAWADPVALPRRAEVLPLDAPQGARCISARPGAKSWRFLVLPLILLYCCITNGARRREGLLEFLRSLLVTSGGRCSRTPPVWRGTRDVVAQLSRRRVSLVPWCFIRRGVPCLTCSAGRNIPSEAQGVFSLRAVHGGLCRFNVPPRVHSRVALLWFALSSLCSHRRLRFPFAAACHWGCTLGGPCATASRICGEPDPSLLSSLPPWVRPGRRPDGFRGGPGVTFCRFRGVAANRGAAFLLLSTFPWAAHSLHCLAVLPLTGGPMPRRAVRRSGNARGDVSVGLPAGDPGSRTTRALPRLRRRWGVPATACHNPLRAPGP